MEQVLLLPREEEEGEEGGKRGKRGEFNSFPTAPREENRIMRRTNDTVLIVKSVSVAGNGSL